MEHSWLHFVQPLKPCLALFDLGGFPWFLLQSCPVRGLHLG